MPEATKTTTDMYDLRALTDSAKQWLASREGQVAMRQVLQEAREGCERFDREIRVDRDTLRVPITL